MAYGNPTVPLRRLAAELRRLYDEARERDPTLNLDVLAERLEKSDSSLSRMLNAKTRVDLHFLPALLDELGVPADDPLRPELLALARRSKERGWWRGFGDVVSGPYVGFESAAKTIRAYESELVPGLLQTEAYASEIVRAALVRDPHEVKRRVAARMARQEILRGESPTHLRAVINEAVVRRPVGGPEVMAEQLRALAQASVQPHVTVQVLPFDAGPHAGMMGPFVIMEFHEPTDPTVVYLENQTQSQDVEEPEAVDRYTLVFDHLQQTALSVDRSAALMEVIASELVRERTRP